ncbi:MAG: hypothetical protein ACRDNZ_23625, partial [Streptosporangiaceae bacterium]
MTRHRRGTRSSHGGIGGNWGNVRAVCFDLGGTLVVLDQGPTTGQVARLLGITLDDARMLMEEAAKRRRA